MMNERKGKAPSSEPQGIIIILYLGDKVMPPVLFLFWKYVMSKLAPSVQNPKKEKKKSAVFKKMTQELVTF